MNNEELRRCMMGLARVGKVMDVKAANRTVRVKFESEGIISGWLYVVQHYGANLYIKPDDEHTHTITDTYTGGGSASTQPNHDHSPGSCVTYWMPKVNDTVLCLYLPTDDGNGDGFVLGGI